MIRKCLHKSLLFVMGCFILLNTGCSSTPAQPTLDPISVKLNWEHSVQFLGMYVAQQQGYYAGENLAVTLVPIINTFETDESIKKVSGGEIDFGIAATSVLLRYRDFPLTIVAALYQYSPATLFARAELGIHTPADLAGHSVAVKSATWSVLIDRLLALSGLSPEQITKVEAGFDMTPFYNGEVDVWAGWITNEVVVARLHGLDIMTMPFYEYGIENTDNMIYTSQEMVGNYPDLVERFLRATMKGWAWAVENPDAAVDIFIELFPDKAADRAFHLSSFEASIPLIIPGGTRPGTLNCQAAQFQEQMLDEAFCDNQILLRIWDKE